MDRDDEVGEVDFPFDLSDWMVVDEHAEGEDEVEDKDGVPSQTGSNKGDGEVHSDSKSSKTEEKVKGAKGPVKSKSNTSNPNSGSSTQSLKPSSTTKTVSSKTDLASGTATGAQKAVIKSATSSKVNKSSRKKSVVAEKTPSAKGSTSKAVSQAGNPSNKEAPAKTQATDSLSKAPSASHTPQKQTSTTSTSPGSASSQHKTPVKTTSASKKVTADSPKLTAVPTAISQSKPADTLQPSTAGKPSVITATTSSLNPPHTTSISIVGKDTADHDAAPKTTSATSPSELLSTHSAHPAKTSVISSPKPAISQTKPKSPAPVKQATEDSDCIAEIMVSGEDKDDEGGSSSSYDYDMSDTEFSELVESKLPSGSEKPKAKGTKRETSPHRKEPALKKVKLVSSVKTSNVATTESSNAASSMAPLGSKKSEETAVKKVGKKQASNATSATKKSFGAVKTPVTKPKAQTTASSAPIKLATTKLKGETPTSTLTTPATTKAPVKRIVRRFHRTTQTVPKQYKSKLLQCLIRIPALDAPSKLKSSIAVQTTSEMVQDEVFYQKELPETLRPEIFKTVSAFNVNKPSSRSIPSGQFDFGISLGHVTNADVEKSLFRENILTKADYYDLFFDRQDFGVVDLFFGDEEKFTTVVTYIRKTRIGPRHLAVTLSKNLRQEDCDAEHPLKTIKATVIFDQNFSSTAFLTHMKAPVWNKPKVEEYITIHNVPGGIPLDFLRLLIPDAITVDMDDEKLQLTQEGSRVRLGMNRKNGSDRFTKLFTQIYLNNECLVVCLGLTHAQDSLEMKEILNEKRLRPSDKDSKTPLREINAVPRDINDVPIVIETDDEDTEVVMQVDHEEQVETVLSGRSAAWKGPTTIAQLRKIAENESRAADQLKSTVNQSVSMHDKDPDLSDVSEDLSDISDTSLSKSPAKVQAPLKKKPSYTQRNLSRLTPGLRTTPSHQRAKGRDYEAGHLDDRGRRTLQEDRDNKRKSRSIASSEGRGRLERRDGSLTDSRYSDKFQEGSRHRSPSPRSVERGTRYHSPSQRSVEKNTQHRAPSQRSMERNMTNNQGQAMWQNRGGRMDLHGNQQYDRPREDMAKYYQEYNVRQNRVESTQVEKPLSSREILRRERLELERQEKEKKERYSKTSKPGASDRDGDRLDERGGRHSVDHDRSRSRERREGTDPRRSTHEQGKDGRGSLEKLTIHRDDTLRERHGDFMVRAPLTKSDHPSRQGRYGDEETSARGSRREVESVDDTLRRYALNRIDSTSNERRDSLTKYDASRRGKLDRLVQERLSSLERHDREREHDQEDERRVVRAGSPVRRQIVRGRSTSPKRGGSAPRGAGPSRRLSPSPSGTYRRVTISRKSASPRRPPPQSSALSPISLGDENEASSNLQEGSWLSQPPTSYDYPSAQGRDSTSHIQSLAGRMSREDIRKSVAQAGTSNNLVAVQTELKDPRFGNMSGDGPERKQADKSFLEKFVEELIATSRAPSTPRAPAGTDLSPKFAPGIQDPVKFLEKMREIYGSGVKFTDSGSGVSPGGPLSSSSHGQSAPQSQGGNVRMAADLVGGLRSSDSQRLAARPGFPAAEDSSQRGSHSGHMSSYESRPTNYEITRDLPPPIPPPVAPPLFTPVASSQDRITQMEALAKQLAADIEKQTQPQQMPQSVWTVPPVVTMAMSTPPHRMMGQPPHLQGPLPPMSHAGPLPFTTVPGAQPHIRPPHIGPPPDVHGMAPHPLWPPPGRFF